MPPYVIDAEPLRPPDPSFRGSRRRAKEIRPPSDGAALSPGLSFPSVNLRVNRGRRSPRAKPVDWVGTEKANTFVRVCVCVCLSVCVCACVCVRSVLSV